VSLELSSNCLCSRFLDSGDQKIQFRNNLCANTCEGVGAETEAETRLSSYLAEFNIHIGINNELDNI
jgi:hypothetical protein